MVEKRLWCRVAVLVLLASGVLAVLPPGSAHAAGPGCCQCPLPSCGPPVNGKCSQGCTLTAGAVCDGRTGRCKTGTALGTPLLGGYPSRPVSATERTGLIRLDVPTIRQ